MGRKVVDLGCQTRFHGAPHQHYCCDVTDPRSTRARPRSLKINTANENPVTLHGSELEEVKAFTYLGSITDKQSSTYADVRARTGKARAAYLQLTNIWSSKVVSTVSGCSTLTSSQSYCMEQRHGGQRRPPSGKFKDVHQQLPEKDPADAVTISNVDLWQRTNQLPEGKTWRQL